MRARRACRRLDVRDLVRLRRRQSQRARLPARLAAPRRLRQLKSCISGCPRARTIHRAIRARGAGHRRSPYAIWYDSAAGRPLAPVWLASGRASSVDST